MPEADLIQRQRDALRTFRQADRARREAEAAAHKAHEQATTAADAAHKTAQQNAENTRTQALAAAESQHQSAQRSAASTLEGSRSRAKQQMDAISVVLRDGRNRVKNAELGHLWPNSPTKIGAVASAQAEAEVARRAQLAAQTGKTLANAVNQWKEEQASAAQLRRIYFAAAAAGLVILILGVISGISRYQEYQAAQRAQATATAQAEIVQATATAQAEIVQATATAIASLPFPDRMKAISSIEFLEVPAGDFTMGSPDGQGNANEHPQHTVYLDDYWIGRTEVTNAQYARCVEAGGCPAPGNDRWPATAFAEHPVTNVSWNDAVAYTRWLSELSNLAVRLPTEAEWEKAARGTDGRRYPWGDAQPSAELLNFDGSGVGDTTAVGSYPTGASPYGALDMAGNVWEWVGDWYAGDYYQQSPERNPTGPESGQYRVVRGGAWYSYHNFAAAAVRLRFSPYVQWHDNGFRVVWSASVPVP